MKRMIVARGGKRGKTAGRGGKGQSARAGNKRRPEWRDIIKKLPKLRGRGINPLKSIQDRAFVVNLAVIEGAFSAGESITPAILLEKGIVSTWSGKVPVVKILGDGEATKAYKISGCFISASAKAKVEKAGGTVEAVVVETIQDKAAIAAKPAKDAKAAAAKIAKAARVAAAKLAPAAEAKPGKSAKSKPAKKDSAKPAKDAKETKAAPVAKAK